MPTLTYLSGAPRVSTRPDAEAGGARAHVLGIIRGFEYLGWRVQTHITGDKLPRFVTGQGSEGTLYQNRVRAAVADVVRMGLNVVGQLETRRLVPGTDLAYERYGAFQSLGTVFQRAGIPWIVETQGVDFHNSYKESRTTALLSQLRRAETRAYQSCDGIICSTEDAQQQIMDFSGVPPWKILVLPNAVDTENYDPSHYRSERLFNEFTVGFVGTLYPWQGLELLFEAIRDIKAHGQGDIRAVIIGDGIHRHALERQVVELGLGEEVKFVGQVAGPKAPELLLGCDVSYVGHQMSESGDLPFSPIKLYESMSLALPVIAPAVPQFSNLIVPGQEGFLFAPNDPENLGRALTRASRAGQALKAMGQRGRIQVVQKHSWPQRVERLLEWLQYDRKLLSV